MSLPTMPAYTCPQIDEALDRVAKALGHVKKAIDRRLFEQGIEDDERLAEILLELEGRGASPSVKDLLETVRQANKDLRELAELAEDGKKYRTLEADFDEAQDDKKDLEARVDELEREIKSLKE